MNDINIKKVDLSPGNGKCNICQSELATTVISISNVHEVRFCETCFDKFKSMVVGPANPAKLLETVKDLGWWAEQVVSAPKDAGSKECGEFVKMHCKEALASKRRNCDEFAGDVADAATNMYGKFIKFCGGRECSDCKVRELWSDESRHTRPCFSIWSLMEKDRSEN